MAATFISNKVFKKGLKNVCLLNFWYISYVVRFINIISKRLFLSFHLFFLIFYIENVVTKPFKKKLKTTKNIT